MIINGSHLLAVCIGMGAWFFIDKWIRSGKDDE